ncbi:MAG: Ldh family oxidoreductase [Proteobacteria bacterium]|nr:Ldh family oxidoreductase [Pseudomonadota bacterium]
MAYDDAYTDCKWVEFDVLERFMKDVLMASGIPQEDAGIISDVLITSDKRGIDSHGIGRLKSIYIDRIDAGILNPITKITIVKDKKTTAVLDGNNGMGHVIAKKAMQMAKGKAALTPLGGIGEDTGGYKGYGYATIVEVLCAALQGNNFLKQVNEIDAAGKKVPIQLGHFFIAIDIEEFTELARFKKDAGDIMRELRSSKKAPGQNHIYTAGEKEWIAWQYRKLHGCPVPKTLQSQMKGFRDRFKLNYCFDFEK